MLRTLLATLVVVILVTLGIGIYLQPNDFVGCSSRPSTSSGTKCQSADAIVAISGGDTAARAKQAIELYKNGWGSKIVFSGAAKDKSGPSNAEAMKELAMEDGVPEADILIDEYASTTDENASNSQEIFSKNDINSVILVTSGYHQRRAYLEFEKYANGVTVYNYPLASDNDWSAYWWWATPRGWWLAVGEMVKIIVFYVSGVSS